LYKIILNIKFLNHLYIKKIHDTKNMNKILMSICFKIRFFIKIVTFLLKI